MALRAGISSIITTLRRRSNEPGANAAAAAGDAGANNAPPPAAGSLASASSATSQASAGGAGTPLSSSAAAAAVHNPVGVAADEQGNIYVADAGNYRWASCQARSGRQEAGVAVGLQPATQLPAAANQAAGCCCQPCRRIVKISPDGRSSSVAGGTYGLRDGGPGAAAFLSPAYLALEPCGTRLLVTDQHCVRRIDLASGRVCTIAGEGGQGAMPPGAARRARVAACCP